MKCCSSFRHMLSPLSLVLIFTANVAVAEPACHNLLLPPITKKQITSTIDEIASLRLDLDLAISTGTTSQVSQSLEPVYAKKLEELYDRLQGQNSRVEIREMIRARIAELQGKNGKVAAEEKQDRETKKPELPKQKDSIVLPKEFRGMNYFADYSYYSKMAYLQKTESLIFTKGPLKRHFIEKNRTEVISKNVYSFKVEPDEKSLYFLSKDKQLVRYDLENQKKGPKVYLHHSKELRWDFHRPDFTLSPDKQSVTLFMNNTFEVFDAATGKRLASSLELGQKLEGPITNLQYVSNTEVIGNDKNGFFKFKIPTKEFEALPVELNQPAWDWILTTDLNNIVTRSLDDVGHIALQGPGQLVPTNNTVLAKGSALILNVGIRNEPAFLIFSQKWNKMDYAGIYNPQGGMKRITNMEDRYEMSNHDEIILNAAIAGDGSSLIILVLDNRTGKIRADFIDLTQYVGPL